MTITDSELSLHDGVLRCYREQHPGKAFAVDVDYLLALIREVRTARSQKSKS